MKIIKNNNVDMGLLLVRLALAVAFIFHGATKFTNLDGTVQFFGSIGLAAFFAYLVAAVELLGGIAMLLGVFTDIAGILLAIIMVVAIYFVKFNLGFGGGGYELDLTFLLTSLAIAIAGPGRYALMARKSSVPSSGPAGMN